MAVHKINENKPIDVEVVDEDEVIDDDSKPAYDILSLFGDIFK